MLVKDCKRCRYLESGILAGQSQECISEFSNLLTRYSIEGKGKTVFNQGQPVTHVHFLCKGLVKLSAVTEEGDEVVLDVLAPCSVIGTLPMKGGETHRYTAATVKAMTEVSSLKAEDLLMLISSHPSLGVALAGQLSTRLNQAYRTIVDMKLPVGERLLSVLARLTLLVDRQFQKTPTKIPLSCREVAQLAHTTPETLSRALQSLKKGNIRVEKGLWVLKKEVLEKYVEENRKTDETAQRTARAQPGKTNWEKRAIIRG